MSCRKMSFASRGEAKRVADSSRKSHGDKPSLRPYLCEFCGSWHLTRASKRAVKLRRRLGDDSPL